MTLSVVVATYNGQKLLAKHLPHVLEGLLTGDELIIADDASNDDTESWCQSFSKTCHKRGVNFLYVRSAFNQRYAKTMNMGVSQAKSELTFLLNNDVSPLTSGWREKLCEKFRDPQLFAVGCAEVRSEDGAGPVFGRGTGNFLRGLLVHWYDPDQKKTQTLWTAGGSMMVRTKVFQELGGFDSLFAPAYEEDRDLSWRALKAGWTLQFAPDVQVLHQHETTNESVFGARRIAIMSWKNQYLLVWKNITDRTLLLQHFLWLPYHLTVGAWKSQGASARGFLLALRQLALIPAARRRAQKSQTLPDRAVLNNNGSEPPQQ